MFDSRMYVDLYCNNVFSGFLGHYQAVDRLSQSRQLALETAREAYTTEVVVYAVSFFDTQTGAWLMLDLLNCRLPYADYRNVVAELPYGFQIYCVKGIMEEMYDD